MGPLYIPLSSGPGASQVRVIPQLSNFHGARLLPDEAKILIVNNALCALPPSPSFLCPSVLVSYFLLPSRAGAAIPVSSGPR